MSKLERPGSTFVFEGHQMQNDSFDALGIPMVGKIRTMESYIQQEYAHAASQEGIRFRDQLNTAKAVYGDKLHEIQGDGNCLTTAFSTSLLYVINGRPDLIDQLDRILVELEAHDNIDSVRQVIERLKEQNDIERDAALASNDIMTAFSNVIRHLARQKLPELGEPYNLILDEMVPQEVGKEIDISCIAGVCQILKLRADVIVLRAGYDTYKVEHYPNSSRSPDLVIIRKAAHYLSLVPKATLVAKTDQLAKERISGSQASPLLKPVTIQNSNHKFLIAIAIILALGTLYYLFNLRNLPKIQ